MLLNPPCNLPELGSVSYNLGIDDFMPMPLPVPLPVPHVPHVLVASRANFLHPRRVASGSVSDRSTNECLDPQAKTSTTGGPLCTCSRLGILFTSAAAARTRTRHKPSVQHTSAFHTQQRQEMPRVAQVPRARGVKTTSDSMSASPFKSPVK